MNGHLGEGVSRRPAELRGVGANPPPVPRERAVTPPDRLHRLGHQRPRSGHHPRRPLPGIPAPIRCRRHRGRLGGAARPRPAGDDGMQGGGVMFSGSYIVARAMSALERAGSRLEESIARIGSIKVLAIVALSFVALGWLSFGFALATAFLILGFAIAIAMSMAGTVRQAGSTFELIVGGIPQEQANGRARPLLLMPLVAFLGALGGGWAAGNVVVATPKTANETSS